MDKIKPRSSDRGTSSRGRDGPSMMPTTRRRSTSRDRSASGRRKKDKKSSSKDRDRRRLSSDGGSRAANDAVKKVKDDFINASSAGEQSDVSAMRKRERASKRATMTMKRATSGSGTGTSSSRPRSNSLLSARPVEGYDEKVLEEDAEQIENVIETVNDMEEKFERRMTQI